MAEDLNTIMLLEKINQTIFLDLVMAQIWHWYLLVAILKSSSTDFKFWKHAS